MQCKFQQIPDIGDKVTVAYLLSN